MAIGAVGLQTQIWNNNLKSIFLLAMFPFILLGMVWSFFALSSLYANSIKQSSGYSYEPKSLPDYLYLPPVEAGNYGVKNYWHVPIITATLWLMFSFAFHEWMINAATGARPVSRKENPRIYNLLENLCISRGLPMPKLNIIDEPDVLNAYASGISLKSYSITLTTGIINRLDDAELEAVLAHELTHIMNQDVRLLIISVVFVGMIGFLSQVVYEVCRMMIQSRNTSIRDRDDAKGAMIFLLIGLVVLMVGYFFSQITRFALSRRREYLADAGSVQLTKNPDGLITALKKISGHADLPGAPSDVKQMFIENPPALFGLMGTHPTISDRIAALVGMGGRDLPVVEASQSGPWQNHASPDNAGPWS